MAIDFNKPACISPTQATEFGICDDPPPDENPAYLDFTNCEKWLTELKKTENAWQAIMIGNKSDLNHLREVP
jgi:LPS sulfotransferase NodH